MPEYWETYTINIYYMWKHIDNARKKLYFRMTKNYFFVQFVF